MKSLDERVKELLKVDENIKLTEEEFLSIIKQQFEKRYFPIDKIKLDVYSYKRFKYPALYSETRDWYYKNHSFKAMDKVVTDARSIADDFFISVSKNGKEIDLSQKDVELFISNNYSKEVKDIRVYVFEKLIEQKFVKSEWFDKREYNEFYYDDKNLKIDYLLVTF